MTRRTIAVLVIVTSTGCASAAKTGLMDRFVRRGTPAINLGHVPTDLLAAREPERKRPAAEITTNVSRFSGATMESSDRGLQSALALLTVAPTVEHHLAVAREYRKNGIMDHAMNYLTRSLAVNGPSAAVFNARARLWRDWGHPDLGLTDAHQAVYLAPRSAAYHNTLGTILYGLGQRRDAEEEFRRAAALEPDAWYAFANLCHVNLVQGNTREAIPLCRRATELRKKQQP